MTPITNLVENKNLKQTPKCQQAFDTIKAMIAKDTFLR